MDIEFDKNRSAIDSRYFDVSFYNSQEDTEQRIKLFEGQTTALYPDGLEADVNAIGMTLRKSNGRKESLVNRKVTTRFHAVSSVLENREGQVVSVEDSDDMRYNWTITVKFKTELNLLKLQIDR